jgi:hypothetical protein
VVRIPTVGRPRLIHEQTQKLYAEIQSGVSAIQERKSKLLMGINALEFHIFFQHALDHFCTELNRPFDFVEASFSESRSSFDFDQSILCMAISLKKFPDSLNVSAIFNRLGQLIASCIMLHAIRNNIRGL